MSNNPYQEKPGTVEFYRAFLCDSRKTNQAFANESSNDDLEHAIEVYNRLAKFGSGEMAIEVALATTNLNHLLSPAGRYVASELAKIPKGKTIEGSAIQRLRDVYARLQKNLSACTITINKKDYSMDEIAKAKLNLPAALQDKSWDYSIECAKGSVQDKLKLVLTVID
jgi:hypothetical protein